MRIVLAGGTGFLGRSLLTALAPAGHELIVLTRRSAPPAADGTVRFVPWQPDGRSGPWAPALHGADAVINLPGASLAGGRWTAHRKRILRDSRIVPTASLAAAIADAPAPPAVLITMSGVNVYGPHGDEPVTEDTPPGEDFVARLCVDWEGAAASAALRATRVVALRTAPVLDRQNGLLPLMALPFTFFVGGPLGSGRQYLSWIHVRDWVRLVVWLITASGAEGPVNAAAPQPVTNAGFSRALGRALHRPSWLRVPAWAARLALGEMAMLALTGQRVIPARALEGGFRFEYADIEGALGEIYR